MNKKMEELHAQIKFLSDWIDEIKAEITDDETNVKNVERMNVAMACGFKMIAISKELDKEREAYWNQPLWKKIFTK